jgi:hypothetical protein
MAHAASNVPTCRHKGHAGGPTASRILPELCHRPSAVRQYMAMRYPVRTRSTRRKRMGGLSWRLRSDPRPRKSRGCVTH